MAEVVRPSYIKDWMTFIAILRAGAKTAST